MSEVSDVLKTVKELNEDPLEKKLWLISTIIVSTLAFVLIYFWVNPILSTNQLINQLFINFTFLLAAFVAGWLVTSTIFFLIKYSRKIFLRVKSLRGYSWKFGSGLKDFYFQGNIVINKQLKAIHIIQSDLGLILKNKEWKDYQMEFSFNMPEKPSFSPEDEDRNQWRRGFGVIYRANRLGEYYMLKVDINGYHPHVRQVLWENNGPIFYTSLTISDLGKWVKAKFIMRDNFLKVKIGKDEFEFTLPTHSNISRDIPKEKSKNEKPEEMSYSTIRFRDFGSIGFRSAFYEEVYIKDLRVNKNFTWSSVFSTLHS